MNETPPNFAHIFSIGLVSIKNLKLGPRPPNPPFWASKRLFLGIFSKKQFFSKKYAQIHAILSLIFIRDCLKLIFWSWWKKITQKGGPGTRKSHFLTKNTIFSAKYVNKLWTDGLKTWKLWLKIMPRNSTSWSMGSSAIFFKKFLVWTPLNFEDILKKYSETHQARIKNPVKPKLLDLAPSNMAQNDPLSLYFMIHGVLNNFFLKNWHLGLFKFW